MHNIVSIITPTFNRGELISETIQSAINQSYPHWEMIIVDDGSTDSTIGVIQKFIEQDNRIEIHLRDREPKGACACRNIGVEKAVGKYLLFLDSDDLLEPFCLEQRVRAMESEPEIDFGIFPTLVFDRKPYDLNKRWNIDKETPDLLRHLYLDAICQTSGVLVKKDAFQQIGGWCEDISMWQDIDLFLRMHIMDLPYKKFFDLPPDMHHRVNSQSLSRNDYFAPEKIAGRKKVYQRAVLLLEQYGKHDIIPEAKYIAGAVISGYARRRLFHDAISLIDWSVDHSVITVEESEKWKGFVQHTRFRLYKIPLLKKRMEASLKDFNKESTIGKIHFKQDIQNLRGSKTKP